MPTEPKSVNSGMHKFVACNLRLHSKVNSTVNVENHLSSALANYQIYNRKGLKLIMSTLKSLAVQGLEFRGGTEDYSNFNTAIKTLVDGS